jgi:uncharacterized Tic20 family protein
MPQSPFAPSESARQRWQFSIRGMLIFTASVAIGLSIWQTKLSCWSNYGYNYSEKELAHGHESFRSGWSGGLIGIFVFWMLLGIAHQIRDLWSYLRTNPAIDEEQKRGLRFEISWRIAVILCLLFLALLAVFLDRGFITLSYPDDSVNFDNGNISEAILLLLLMVIVGCVPQAEVKPKWPLFHQGVSLLAWAVLLTLAYNRWQEESVMPALTHIATVTMDMAFPLKYSAIDPVHYRKGCLFFYHWSLVSAGLVLFNWLCLRRLARQWSASIIRRWFWAGLLTAGVMAVGSYFVWIWVRGLREFSPYIAEVGILRQPLHCWLGMTAMYLVLIMVTAYRMTVDRKPAPLASSVSWRRNCDKYYHEWRGVLLGLGIAIIGFRYFFNYKLQALNQVIPFDTISVNWRTYGPRPPVYSFRFFADTFFSRSMDLLWTGLLILCIVRAFGPRQKSNQIQAELPRVSWEKFITIWLATAAFLVSGTLALVWMSFGLWLNPWSSSR